MKTDHIRVFVSSTFSDLIAERNHLARQTFPLLEKRSRELGLMFSTIDLRWGITDEQVAEGDVLPICLDAIDRSHPFFIGILGDRYGWVPDDVSSSAALHGDLLRDERGLSITELEMVHGVLSKPFGEIKAYFYEREPASPPAGDAGRISQLKQRIRSAGHDITPFRSCVELGRLVERDLTATLDSVQVSSRDEHEERGQALTRQLALSGHLPRQSVESDLAGITTERSIVVVRGPSGSGKTALACRWLNSAGGGDSLDLFYSCSATTSSEDWRELCRFLGRRLSLAGGSSFAEPLEGSELREEFIRAIHSAARIAAPVRLVLDAVDQLGDEDGALDLAFLPLSLPPGVQLVLTTSDQGAAVGQGRRRGWGEFVVPALVGSEKAGMVVEMLRDRDKSLAHSQLERIADAPGASTPRFLSILCHELDLTATHEHLDRTLDEYLGCADALQLMDRVLARLEFDYEDVPGLTRHVMISLWASSGGLSDSELAAATARDGLELPTASLARVLVGAGRLLLTRGEMVSFASEEFGRAVEHRYLGSAEERSLAWRGLAAAIRGRDPLLLTERTLRVLPNLLVASRDWQALVLLVTDLKVLGRLTQVDEALPVRLWALLREHGHDPAGLYEPLIEDPLVRGDQLEPVAVTLYSLGELAAARAAFQKAAEWAKRQGEPGGFASCLGMVAYTYLEEGDPSTARRIFADVLAAEFAAQDAESAIMRMIQISDCHRALNELDDALDWVRSAEEAARRQGLLDKVALALLQQADIHESLEDPDAASEALDEAVKVAQSSSDQQLIQQVLTFRSIASLDAGSTDEATHLSREAERLARAAGPTGWQSTCESLVGQGVVSKERGDQAAALHCYAEAAQLYRLHGDMTGLAQMLQAQALLGSVVEVDQRIALLEEAVTILIGAEQDAVRQLLAMEYCDEGDRLRETDVRAARAYLQRALELFGELDDDDGRSLALTLQAFTWSDESPEKALDIHRRAEAVFRGSGRRPKDPHGLSWCLCHQADLLVRLNQRTAALSALAEGERIFHKTNDRDGHARVAEIKGRAVSQDQAAAAGWYPDPWEESDLRYWDGRQWTGYVH